MTVLRICSQALYQISRMNKRTSLTSHWMIHSYQACKAQQDQATSIQLSLWLRHPLVSSSLMSNSSSHPRRKERHRTDKSEPSQSCFLGLRPSYQCQGLQQSPKFNKLPLCLNLLRLKQWRDSWTVVYFSHRQRIWNHSLFARQQTLSREIRSTNLRASQFLTLRTPPERIQSRSPGSIRSNVPRDLRRRWQKFRLIYHRVKRVKYLK